MTNLEIATDYLDARQNPDDASEYIYFDDATRSNWVVGARDMEEFGQQLGAFHSGEYEGPANSEGDLYSHWCNSSGARLKENTKAAR